MMSDPAETVEEHRERARYWKLEKRKTVIFLAIIGTLAFIKPDMVTVLMDFLQEIISALFEWRTFQMQDIDF